MPLNSREDQLVRMLETAARGAVMFPRSVWEPIAAGLLEQGMLLPGTTEVLKVPFADIDLSTAAGKLQLADIIEDYSSRQDDVHIPDMYAVTPHRLRSDAQFGDDAEQPEVIDALNTIIGPAGLEPDADPVDVVRAMLRAGYEKPEAR